MILNGAGDPRTITPIPDGTNDKVYVDDLTGAVYSAVGFPATWSPVKPPIVASLDLTAQGANVASQTLFTTSVTGFYEVACYAIVTQAATTSSTLPSGLLQWTDPDTNAQVVASAISSGVTGNTVGANGVNGGANTRMFYAKAGTSVLFSTTGYASSGATAMQFSVHVRAFLISN